MIEVSINGKTRFSSAGGTRTVLAALMLTALGCILSGGCVPTAEDLGADAFEVGDAHYLLHFYQDGGGGVVATASVRVEYSDNLGLCSMKVDVTHDESTEIDRISLEFSPVKTPEAVALVTPEGYSWPRAEYHATEEGIICTIADLGSIGRGTVGFEFLVRKYFLGLPLQDNKINLRVNLATHETGRLVSAVQRGEGEIGLEIA
ncbi:MAG: hypothetical protein QUS09_06765 [Methanotrichaceae archaeon]|nr:hypothetical protein [Methanotrichaceae archaeon]